MAAGWPSSGSKASLPRKGLATMGTAFRPAFESVQLPCLPFDIHPALSLDQNLVSGSTFDIPAGV